MAAPFSDTAIAAFIDNEPIAAGEVRMQMRRLRAQVFDYFSRTYGAKDSPDFGNLRFLGESPAIVLRDRALDSCVRIKTEQMIARNERLVDKIDFVSFVREFQLVNKQRFQTVMQGGIIYGPVTYHIDSYFDYLYSNMMIDLQKKLTAAMSFDDAVLRREFGAYRASVSDKPLPREVLFVFSRGANARAAMESLRAACANDTSCDAACSSKDISCEKLRLERITRELIGTYGRTMAGMLLDSARILAVGKESPVFEGERGEFGFVKCLRIGDISGAAFPEYREKIREYLKNITFRSAIEERCAKAAIRKNRQVLDGLAVW